MQLVIYDGNLTRDPEMRYTPSGQAVCNINMASNSQYTNAAGDVVKNVIWLRVTAWGKLAEACNKYLKKGAKVLVTGKLKAGEDGNPVCFEKKDGTWASSFEITASAVEFLTKPTETSDSEGSFVGAPDEDIPF